MVTHFVGDFFAYLSTIFKECTQFFPPKKFRRPIKKLRSREYPPNSKETTLLSNSPIQSLQCYTSASQGYSISRHFLKFSMSSPQHLIALILNFQELQPQELYLLPTCVHPLHDTKVRPLTNMLSHLRSAGRVLKSIKIVILMTFSLPLL